MKDNNIGGGYKCCSSCLLLSTIFGVIKLELSERADREAASCLLIEAAAQ